jgi:hypothetical protein
MDGRTVWDGVRQKLMGIKATRGKWKSAVPNHKNVFVFRWGPIFEDCAGKALASTAAVHLAQPPGSISMRPLPLAEMVAAMCLPEGPLYDKSTTGAELETSPSGPSGCVPRLPACCCLSAVPTTCDAAGSSMQCPTPCRLVLAGPCDMPESPTPTAAC